MNDEQIVYIVTAGRWEDYRIEAVFADQARAKHYADALTRAGVGRYGDEDDVVDVSAWVVDHPTRAETTQEQLAEWLFERFGLHNGPGDSWQTTTETVRREWRTLAEDALVGKRTTTINSLPCAETTQDEGTRLPRRGARRPAPW